MSRSVCYDLSRFFVRCRVRSASQQGSYYYSVQQIGGEHE